MRADYHLVFHYYVRKVLATCRACSEHICVRQRVTTGLLSSSSSLSKASCDCYKTLMLVLMADPLMVLSLQPPPFLIFSSSSLNRRWGLSRSGIRFSVPEFRLSSQLQLSNSTSPSQSSSSSTTAPDKLDLVSSTRKPCFLFFLCSFLLSQDSV